MPGRVAFSALGWLVPAALVLIPPAHALDPSGTAVAVVQATNATGPGGARVLGDAKPVFSGDTIKTGDIGRAQIRFNDDTRLVVSSNSSVVIDRFVVAASGSAGGATMNFARGAFRFMSGTGASEAYALQTPTATIGVRGTEFDISVGPQGTQVLVFDGAVEVCNRASGACTVVDRYCGSVLARPDGTLTRPGSKGETNAVIRASFPLALNQKGLRHGFRVTNMGCGAERNTSPNGRGGPRSARRSTDGGGGGNHCGGGKSD